MKPLLLAALAPVAGQLVSWTMGGGPSRWLPLLVILLWIWCFSAAAGIVFVLPLFAVAPRLRVPSWRLAVLWGAVVAAAFYALLIYWWKFPPIGQRGWEQLALDGAAGGLVYALLSRRTAIQERK